MEQNNPYIEKKIESKSKTTEDSKGRSILIFVVVIVFLLVSFIVGIFLGNARGNDVIKEKDQMINQIQADLDQANKQIDSFSEDSNMENISKVDGKVIESLQEILNESNIDELDQYVVSDVQIVINSAEAEEMSSQDLIDTIDKELSESEGSWTQMNDQEAVDNLNDGSLDDFLSSSAVLFESENDFIISFTFKGDTLTKVLIISEEN